MELRNVDPARFRDSLRSKDYAEVFRDNFCVDILDGDLSSSYGIERINAIIFGLENTTMIPHVLYILRNVKDQKERDKIFEYLESYMMRRLVCHSVSN